MKKFLFVFLFLVFAPFAKAQSTVNLSWVLSTSDTTTACAASGTCHQTVYRAPGACSATSSFISLAVISATQATYSDTAVPNGTWCYGVSFTETTAATPESTKDTLTVSLQPPQPAPPTGLKRN